MQWFRVSSDEQGQHLPKLLYRQMVDYRIADRTELVGLLHQHRLERYLDGPNDVDWVFRNDLVAGRENDMYVDLVQTEDGLEWWPPLPSTVPPLVPDAVRLVLALQDSGMFAAGALKRLERSWVDFDPTVESHFGDWSDRTANALRGGPSASLAIACELWPMPMTELELEEIVVTDEEIEERSPACSRDVRAARTAFRNLDAGRPSLPDPALPF